jgi:DNA-binding transcriptional LysR family regulator
VTLTQLRALVAASRTGSFTAAAAELGLTQASVSELIRRLEGEYRLGLFIRGPRRLNLTAAGRALLPFAEHAVSAADSGSQALRALRALEGGVAIFGVLRNADYYLLSDLAQEFHKRYPGVRIRLVGQNSVEVGAAVAAGELEAGLVVLPINDDGLSVKPLLRDEVIYISADPARCRLPVTIHALSRAPLILYDAHYGWTDPTRRQVADRARISGLTLEPVIEVEYVEAALRLVALGVGDTFISRAVAASPACPPSLSSAAFDPPLYDTIALITRTNTVLSPATQAITELARRSLLRQPPRPPPPPDPPAQATSRHAQRSRQ